VSPFVVLSVCMGNICRSPMSERLLVHAVRDRVGPVAEDLLVSESAGTGDWHVGQSMNGPAARELRRRGVAEGGFRARTLASGHLETADLVLTATAEQAEYARQMRPDATDRVFVLGEFARLAADVDPARLPRYAPDPVSVYERGVALVAEVDRLRAGAPSRGTDDLDDPWGLGDAVFQGTAETITVSLATLVDLLFPAEP
jgi:protein-tyrosine phosphatase